MLRSLLWGADPARRHAAERARVPPHDGRCRPGRPPEHRCAGAAMLPHPPPCEPPAGLAARNMEDNLQKLCSPLQACECQSHQ